MISSPPSWNSILATLEIVSVSIFGLLLFVYVKNQIKKRIDFYLQEKTKDSKRHNNLSNFS